MKTGQISVDVSAFPQDNIEELKSLNHIVELNDIFTPTQRALFNNKLEDVNSELEQELDLYIQDYRNVKDSIKSAFETLKVAVERHKISKKYDKASSGPEHIDFSFLSLI